MNFGGGVIDHAPAFGSLLNRFVYSRVLGGSVQGELPLRAVPSPHPAAYQSDDSYQER
ncbi:hypothetical protein H6G89_05160 [Oscillatoria sp. FACHB-1407]|uniref:hypothetical protein n=1 Tax=Oscillatoria sp. FACHB-1407 TaxID=2692847 RepID=UPI001686E041|nr:hypothetical protein [Oscillatoria sp. FACHB-1407]MBD2460427.1 hypothetical protein [Oscillatoria sp. FACHB-1407]